METVIGFVVGYLVGTQQGREGLAKVKESVESIRRAPEVRQALTIGAAMAGELVRRTLKGDAGALITGVVDRILPKEEERDAA